MKIAGSDGHYYIVLGRHRTGAGEWEYQVAAIARNFWDGGYAASHWLRTSPPHIEREVVRVERWMEDGDEFAWTGNLPEPEEGDDE